MVANLTRLFQFVGLFSQLAKFPKDQFELQIRVDYMEPTSTRSFAWVSYAVLPNGSALLLESRKIQKCATGCNFTTVLMSEEYDSIKSLIVLKGGRALWGVYPPTLSLKQKKGAYGAGESDMSMVVANSSPHLNGDSWLVPITELGVAKIKRRLISRRFTAGTVYGFDQCRLTRVYRRAGQLYLEGLYDLDGNSSQMSPRSPLDFCFRDPNGYPQTQFFSPEMLKIRRTKFNGLFANLPGIATVRLSLVPRRLQWFRRAYRLAVEADFNETELLIALVIVLGVVLALMDAAIILLLMGLFNATPKPRRVGGRKESPRPAHDVPDYWVEMVPEDRITIEGTELALTPGDDGRQPPSSSRRPNRRMPLESLKRLFPRKPRLQKTQQTAESVQRNSVAPTPVGSVPPSEEPPRPQLEKTQIASAEVVAV